MGKVALYLFVVLSYLGLANSLSPYRQFKIRDETMLSQVFPSENLSIILDSMNSTGLFLKTKYHIYKVFYGFSSTPEVHRFQVSSSFYAKHTPHLGMSILSRGQSFDQELDIPLPPGSSFIGEPVFGRWATNQEGNVSWRFHVPYKNLPQLLGWGSFLPTKDFYQQMMDAISERKAFFGTNHEFGSEGKLTKLKKDSVIQIAKWKDQIWEHMNKLSYNPYQTRYYE